MVHTHTPKAGLIGPAAARLAGIPRVIHTVHGLLFHDCMPGLRQAIFWVPEKMTATLCDYLLSQSREDMETAVRSQLCDSERIMYLGNGIDVAHFAPPVLYARAEKLQELGLHPGDFIVGSVGRLVKEKGFEDLFAAAETLSGCYPDMKFVVIGPREPDQKDSLDPLYMEDLERRGVVRFMNWCEDMTRWYAAMDVFTLASYREGVPRVCMEAAAMMIPIVATDIRGCRKVVLHGKTGLLVSLGDASQLAQAIETLYKNRELARRMGERARQHIVENFNRQQVCKRLCEFYARLKPPSRGGTCEEPAYD